MHRGYCLEYDVYFELIAQFYSWQVSGHEMMLNLLGDNIKTIPQTRRYKFAAASVSECVVFGSACPGFTDSQVNEWVTFMQRQGIQRVCCLLSANQLNRYSNLLSVYQDAFGLDRICWTPIADFSLADPKILIHQILPFLTSANQRNEAVVVHCSGGVGRTGHVLAAWLIAGRGFSKQSAIAAVKKMGRNPHEAVIAACIKGRNPWKVAAELNTLLETLK